MAEDRQQLLAEADRAARKGDLASAAACYERLLRETPNDLAVLQRFGDALARCGREDDARQVFSRLADEYWTGGFKSRAIAVLRRSARLGKPDPALLSLLGERTLESGQAADAREPLAQAARIYETHEQPAEAERVWRLIAGSNVRDVDSREALMRLAVRTKDAARTALARMDLAVCQLRRGDVALALSTARAALADEPERLTGLSRISDFVRTADEFPLHHLDVGGAAGEGPAVAAGWTVVRAAFLARAHDPAAPAPLEALVGAAQTVPPRALAAAGRILLDLGRVEPAARGILAAAERAAADTAFAAELLDALTALIARDPTHVGAAGWIEKLSAVAPTRRPPRPPAAVIEGAAEPSAQAVPELSSEAQIRLVEARSLSEHGLHERAREVLDSIEPGLQKHPRVVELRAEIARHPRRRESDASPVAHPARSTRPVVPPDEDDLTEMIVVLDEEGQPTAVTGVAEDVRTARASETHPVEVPAHGAGGGALGGAEGTDVEELELHIRHSIPQEDCATQYEMAIGLSEMGLSHQAMSMLAAIRHWEGHTADVALLLVKLASDAQDWPRAYDEAGYALALGDQLEPDTQAQLLAFLADVGSHLGRTTEAEQHLAVLAARFPGHPAVDALRARRSSS